MTLPVLDLGQYPILQFGLAAIGFTVTAVGLWFGFKGEKWGKKNIELPNTVAELYFDGPLKGIFEALIDIKGRQLVTRLEIKDDFAVLLSGSRNAIIDRIAGMESEVCDKIVDVVRAHEAAMENRFRDLGGNVNTIHSRLDTVIQTLGKLEGHHEPPPRRGGAR